MLIKSICLTNFRQFIGTQEVIFSTDKERNVTSLVGENTSGKTAFIRAFEWCLYNKIGFEDKILLNMDIVEKMNVGETQTVVGKVVIYHDNTDYEITRSCTYTCTGPDTVRESLKDLKMCYLQADGQTKTFIETHDIQDNISRILPVDLSSYFFFGGERINSISSRADIESSVKGLMGLDVLDNARLHLKKVIAQFKKNLDLTGNEDAIRANQNLESKIKNLKVLQDKYTEIQNQIEYYEVESDKYAALLKENENTASDQKRREALTSIITSLEERIVADSKMLVSYFNKDAFSFFGIPLIKQAISVLDNIDGMTDYVPHMHSEAIKHILDRGYCICGTNVVRGSGSAAEQNLLKESEKQPPESIGGIVNNYKEASATYIASSEFYETNVNSKYADIRKQQRDLGNRKDELKKVAEMLEGKKDTKSLDENYRAAIKKLEQLKKDANTNQQTQGACNKDIENLDRALDSLIKSNEKNRKISQCIDYATATFEFVNDAYLIKEREIRTKLEEKVNFNFSVMYHGSRTLTIDEKYRVKYSDVTTEESDGLKVVKSFAFITGLVELAKEALTEKIDMDLNLGARNYPLAMDAPFSNLDPDHISNICNRLPEIGEQVIIAVTDKDWAFAEQDLKPYLGKRYDIKKDKKADGTPNEKMSHIIEEEI
jgi:DNA sulfur modification protein DndD